MSGADPLWFFGSGSACPGSGLVTLASWELPCAQTPRRKLQGCARKAWRGSHSHVEAEVMEQKQERMALQQRAVPLSPWWDLKTPDITWAAVSA